MTIRALIGSNSILLNIPRRRKKEKVITTKTKNLPKQHLEATNTMLTRNALFLIASALGCGASGTPQNRLLQAEDSGLKLARLLQGRDLQFDDLPDICSGYELIIDEIPNGRDSCDCDGLSIHCLFHAVCQEGSDDPRCADAVMYEVSFEDDELTILSCAAIAEGNFLETCAKISLGPDLMLDQCIQASYGGEPCDCEVCEDRAGLSLDCTMYDERAQTDCQSMALGQVSPMVHGFNHSAPVPAELPTVDDAATHAAATASGSAGTQKTILAMSVYLVVFSMVAFF